MAVTLRFVVDHLLRPGAKGEGRGRFTGFTFDHVVSGAAMARPDTTGTVVLVQAQDNLVTERSFAAPCAAAPRGPLSPPDPGPRPPNVLVFRPRGA
ncbi:hypothetical protein F4692_000723 [Nocardioides cavernae]|uniref:Uncharacterized protein n=1 Tax=Nocardioides cavernae TaxID=1921566 RepID=A0A7Y9H1Z0_9ACTN|nr:hypothetical protein [Nocardioides cavernae]NYE35619.1 hypothetical protein [Nocardioides cavernae]